MPSRENFPDGYYLLQSLAVLSRAWITAMLNVKRKNRTIYTNRGPFVAAKMQKRKNDLEADIIILYLVRVIP